METGAFAVLLFDESAETLRAAAPHVAVATRTTIADALHRLVRGAGFAIERTDRVRADEIVARLRVASIEAQVVPQASVVALPESRELKYARVETAGLAYRGLNLEGTAEWDSILWIDLLEFAERRIVQKAGVDSMGFDDGESEQSISLPQIVEERPLAIELTVADPLRRFRIRNDRFGFAGTGLKVHTNARQNAIALAIAIGSRATLAEFGPGMAWMRNNSPPRPERLDDPLRYERLLRARLTRLRCE